MKREAADEARTDSVAGDCMQKVATRGPEEGISWLARFCTAVYKVKRGKGEKRV